MTYEEDKQAFLVKFNIRIDDTLTEADGRQLMDLVYSIRNLNDPAGEISNVFFFINQESRPATILTIGNNGSLYVFDTGTIEIDFEDSNSLLKVDSSGTLQSNSPIQSMAHELWHAAYSTGDPEQRYTADPDYAGGAVTFANYVAGISGGAERLTYSGAISTSIADFSDFTAGQNLTFGNPIDVALVAWAPGGPYYDKLDTRLNTTKISDLFIGSDNSQEFYSGTGDDFIYALGGDGTVKHEGDPVCKTESPTKSPFAALNHPYCRVVCAAHTRFWDSQ